MRFKDVLANPLTVATAVVMGLIGGVFFEVSGLGMPLAALLGFGVAAVAYGITVFQQLRVDSGPEPPPKEDSPDREPPPIGAERPGDDSRGRDVAPRPPVGSGPGASKPTEPEPKERPRRPPDVPVEAPPSNRKEQLPPPSKPSPLAEGDRPHNRREIFVVHGHDDATKYAVAHLIGRNVPDAKAVILQEQAIRGQSIIELLEQHGTGASYAVILMTADDVGGRRGEGSADLWPRARQNVVLELGYFIGKLGRQQISILCAPEVEIPSDVLGVGYIKLEGEPNGWRWLLLKELSDAGFKVSLEPS